MTDSALDRAGPPDGPLIVFIHGTRLTRSSWGAVMGRLSDSYRCVALDLPGHGAHAEEPFTLDAAADGVEATIDAAGGGPAVLVGLSLGGYVAMTVAARDPGRVRALVLAGSTAEPRGLVSTAFRLFAWGLVVVPERPLDALNTWVFRRRYAPEIAEPIVASGYWSRGGAEAVMTLAGTRFRDRLKAFGGPILVINGGLDPVFRLGESSFLRGIPHVTRRVLPLAAHLTPLDEPDDFSAAVRAFVDGLGD
ncbi:MAG: alpha/beta fold hydrolase [Chloroflexota bacterium]